MMDSNYTPAFVPPMPIWYSQIEQQQLGEQETPPEGEEEEQTPPPAKDDDKLGEGGTRALAAERARAKAAEAELKKYKDAEDKRKKAEMSELDREKSEKADALKAKEASDRELLKYKLGTAAGLNASLITRIQGDDEAAMKADITELLKLNPGTKVPKADPSSGRKQSAGGSGNTAKDDFTDTIEGLFDSKSGGDNHS